MMAHASGSVGESGKPRTRVPDSVLRSIGFLSFFDRFATPPMLVVLAERTEMSLGQAVQLVAAYALLYAVGQPVWGFFSDRFGRMAVLRTALAGVLVGALASTLFSTYLPLLLARAFTGLMAGALYPTLLTILGDTRTGIERARGLSDPQIYSSLGTTIATLAAGTLAAVLDWRLVFALTPLVVVYRMNAASYALARRVVKVPLAALRYSPKPEQRTAGEEGHEPVGDRRDEGAITTVRDPSLSAVCQAGLVELLGRARYKSLEIRTVDGQQVREQPEASAA